MSNDWDFSLLPLLAGNRASGVDSGCGAIFAKRTQDPQEPLFVSCMFVELAHKHEMHCGMACVFVLLQGQRVDMDGPLFHVFTQ